MLIRLSCVLLALILGACRQHEDAAKSEAKSPAQSKAATRPSVYDAAFWRTWGDGQAELAAYDLTYPRYREQRRGVAVAIYVTETFSNTARVKSDRGNHPPSDEFPVMKLNLVRDFQTGVYDYNLMTSVFLALAPVNGRPEGLPAKVSFSSQEWCGHVYSQALFDEKRARFISHSYFDSEADQSKDLSYSAETSSEDALQMWARGMAWPFLKPGEQKEVAAVRSLETVRLNHVPAEVEKLQLSVSAEPQTVKVPAGTFETEVRRVVDGSLVRTFYVERAVPHRIVKWETSAGESAEMLKSARMKYWQLNRNAGEQALKELGLTRRALRMP